MSTALDAAEAWASSEELEQLLAQFPPTIQVTEQDHDDLHDLLQTVALHSSAIERLARAVTTLRNKAHALTTALAEFDEDHRAMAGILQRLDALEQTTAIEQAEIQDLARAAYNDRLARHHEPISFHEYQQKIGGQ